ncbi:N-terminal EF-hand calcium-binding protein 1 [Plakobranchus ocellatus]|uniref:N-terminal EF-hand calcium-binding protein 1 n=1 Tax=Plakobranchus ocellatus TaxID=259542 RepID=A0AAV3YAN1_9GAST|nr:N-terminal EF-hand calcium-binding protein 1 [Plakobranchus ocellatus]
MAEKAERTEAETEKGMTIFLDVFRRADKNDDGFISWEEFVSYFADGVMGKEELQTLFDEIDSHNTNNIDTNELCTYFSQHLGEFKEIFSLLEEMNKKMTNVLYGTAKVYQESNRTDKFVKRFLMREILNQMSALQRPVEAASDTLDTQAREERADIKPLELEDIIKKSPTGNIVPGRVVRRAKRQISGISTGSEAFECYELNTEGSGIVNTQIDRLAQLIDRLENKVNLDGFRDEEVVAGEDDLVLLVQREFAVKEDSVDEFQGFLRAYVDLTQGFKGCLNASVRKLLDSHCFTIYEIWSNEEKYVQNCDSEATRTLVQKTAELLEKPETVHSMKIPGSWWKREI